MKTPTFSRRGDDGWLDEPVKVFRPDVPAYHQHEQAELVQQGPCGLADEKNAWLSGHFMIWRDLKRGRLPTMRLDFLKRMREAKRKGRSESRNG